MGLKKALKKQKKVDKAYFFAIHFTGHKLNLH